MPPEPSPGIGGDRDSALFARELEQIATANARLNPPAFEKSRCHSSDARRAAGSCTYCRSKSLNAANHPDRRIVLRRASSSSRTYTALVRLRRGASRNAISSTLSPANTPGSHRSGLLMARPNNDLSLSVERPDP